jgi:hypothetical protein
MARQLKGERMDGTRNETILSLFFLEHKERTIPFESSPHCSPIFSIVPDAFGRRVTKTKEE